MIGQIIGSLGGLATSYLDSKAVVKKAEAETKMKIATGEISWEQAAIEASNGRSLLADPPNTSGQLNGHCSHKGER